MHITSPTLSPTRSQYTIADYYPMVPGNTWAYRDNRRKTLSQTVSEIISLNGVTVEKFVTSDGKTVFVRSSEGLNAFKIVMKAGQMTYTPPISMAPRTVSVGQCHTYVSQVTFKILGLTLNLGRIAGSTVLLGEEDVEVPAGHFRNCLKFESTASQKLLWFTVESKLVVWFARGVGGVRYDFTTKVAGLTFRSQKLLIHATLGGKSLPA